MSDGGATIIIPLSELPTCMIKGLNLVQHEDKARGDSQTSHAGRGATRASGGGQP